MSPSVLYSLYGLLAMAAAATALCLPVSSPRPRRIQAAAIVLGIAALAGMGVCWAQWLGAGFEGRSFFIAFSAIAVISAVCVIAHSRPVYSALFFVLVVLAVSGLCILATAEFLAAALVIVYGGAILVTYVFVIMLAQQGNPSSYDRAASNPIWAVVVGFALVAATTQAMVHVDPIAIYARSSPNGYVGSLTRRAENASGAIAGADARKDATHHSSSDSGWDHNLRAVGRTLLAEYVMAVEVAGVLLLIAMVGALAVARKRIDPQDLTAQEQALQAKQSSLGQVGREAKPF